MSRPTYKHLSDSPRNIRQRERYHAKRYVGGCAARECPNQAAPGGAYCIPCHDRIAARAQKKQAQVTLLEATCDVLRGRIATLEEALRPFAEFEFGPLWYGHRMIGEAGDVVVLCGYDAKSKPTGIEVNWSDFANARRVLKPWRAFQSGTGSVP